LTLFPCLPSNNHLGMVYELLWNCFVCDDFDSGFDPFFLICEHIIRDHAPPVVSCLLVALWLLLLEKQIGGIWPIIIGEAIYWLVAHTLVIQFKDTFVEHLSPH
jgi:hypothetical protein